MTGRIDERAARREERAAERRRQRSADVAKLPAAQRAAMRKARETEQRRERRRAQVDEMLRTRVPDRVKPTKQTAAKLQPDPIESLHDRGIITDAQRDAALEIRQAFVEAAGAAMASSMRLDGSRGGGAFGAVEEATTAQIARRKRYRRWAHELSAHIPDALSVTIDIVVDGRGVRQCEHERRWRHGRAADLLVDALRLYAQLAGWEPMVAA